MCASAILAVAVTAQAQAPQTGRGPQGFIGGVVESSKGKEAGVWVIAQTKELPDAVHEDRGHGRRRAFRAAPVAVRDV